MTITARYPGKCVKCHQAIAVGEQIDWVKNGPTRHLHCPDASTQQAAKDDSTWTISRGSGYGGRPFTVGATGCVKRHTSRCGRVFTIISASSRYYAEDGLSFGVGDESGTIYMATVRDATSDEIARYLEIVMVAAEREYTVRRLDDLKRTAEREWDRPEGSHKLTGERLMDTQTIYGGGDWWIIGTDSIWYCRNNGMDGDNWSANNVATGGAGAIGHRTDYTDELAASLRQIAATLGGDHELEDGSAASSRGPRGTASIRSAPCSQATG